MARTVQSVKLKSKPISKLKAPASRVKTAASVYTAHFSPYDKGMIDEPSITKYPSQKAANDAVLKMWNDFEEEMRRGQLGVDNSGKIEKNKVGYYRFQTVDAEGESDLYYSAPDVGVWKVVREYK